MSHWIIYNAFRSMCKIRVVFELVTNAMAYVEKPAVKYLNKKPLNHKKNVKWTLSWGLKLGIKNKWLNKYTEKNWQVLRRKHLKRKIK